MKMGYVLNNPARYLLHSATASGASEPMDTRNAANYAFLMYRTPAVSAIFKLEASHDKTGWLPIATYTATNSSGSAQIAGYYPYVRAAVNAVYSGGGNTGYLDVYYAPGLR